jgi:hypothetical protein
MKAEVKINQVLKNMRFYLVFNCLVVYPLRELLLFYHLSKY